MSEVERQEVEKPRKKKHILLIVVLILLLALLAGAGIAYYVKGTYYQTHFFPNVTVNQFDCSDLDAATVASKIRDQGMTYQLKVTGQDGEELGILTAEDVGLVIDVQKDVEDILSSQVWWKWILAYRTSGSYEVSYETVFDEETLKKSVESWNALQPSVMEAPQDAYLTEYQPEKKAYEIVPETRGSLLDLEELVKVLDAAVQAGESSVDLEAADCYIRAKVTSEDADLQKRAETLNRLVGTRIEYDWNGEEVVLDGDTIQEWILENDGEFAIDEEAVEEFIKQHADANDTYGKKRKFTTVQGVTLTLRSGAYGWRTDQEQEKEELVQLILEGAKVEREPVYRNTAAHKGTKDDIGSSYVEIDLTNQHLYLFQKGKIVLESDFVSGNMSNGNATPAGVFGLTYKTTDAVLRGADYETPVHYWMPFNGNVGMHDATWRATFGGDIYLTSGSHGCINLPLSKAKEIYSYVSKGFPVICYYY